MNHDFTRDQINTAILEMPMMGRHSGVAEWEYAMFSQFLDALPDPAPVADEWEECTIDQIRKGDRVKVVEENLTTEYEHPLLEIRPTSLFLQLLFACGTVHNLDDYNALYRIPAPAQHPDPEKHPLIYCSDLVMDFFWDRRTEAYVSIGDTAFSQDPEDFANWTPAKVVPAGDA